MGLQTRLSATDCCTGAGATRSSNAPELPDYILGCSLVSAMAVIRSRWWWVNSAHLAHTRAGCTPASRVPAAARAWPRPRRARRPRMPAPAWPQGSSCRPRPPQTPAGAAPAPAPPRRCAPPPGASPCPCCRRPCRTKGVCIGFCLAPPRRCARQSGASRSPRCRCTWPMDQPT